MTQEPSGHQGLGKEGGPSSERFRRSVPVLHKPLWGESFCSFVVTPAAGPGGSPTQGPQNPVGGWAGHSVGGGALTSCRGGAWAPQGRGLEPCGRGLVPMGWVLGAAGAGPVGRRAGFGTCGGGAWALRGRGLWGWSLGSVGAEPGLCREGFGLCGVWSGFLVGAGPGVCGDRVWGLWGRTFGALHRCGA